MPPALGSAAASWLDHHGARRHLARPPEAVSCPVSPRRYEGRGRPPFGVWRDARQRRPERTAGGRRQLTGQGPHRTRRHLHDSRGQPKYGRRHARAVIYITVGDDKISPPALAVGLLRKGTAAVLRRQWLGRGLRRVETVISPWATALYRGLRSRSVVEQRVVPALSQSARVDSSMSAHDPYIPQPPGQSLATPARTDLSAAVLKGDGRAPARRGPRQVQRRSVGRRALRHVLLPAEGATKTRHQSSEALYTTTQPFLQPHDRCPLIPELHAHDGPDHAGMYPGFVAQR